MSFSVTLKCGKMVGEKKRFVIEWLRSDKKRQILKSSTR